MFTSSADKKENFVAGIKRPFEWFSAKRVDCVYVKSNLMFFVNSNCCPEPFLDNTLFKEIDQSKYLGLILEN